MITLISYATYLEPDVAFPAGVVRCDVDDCTTTLTTRGSETTTDAWDTAYDQGWRNRTLDRPYGHTTQGDLCPYHADRYDRGLPG